MSKGFTLAEILVVCAISVILGAVALTSLYSTNRTGAVLEDKLAISALLETARGYAIAGKDDYLYGVSLSSTTAAIFRTVSRTATTSVIQTYNVSKRDRITDISLTGGVSYIIFNKNTGYTSDVGTFRISAYNATTSYQTIQIYATGLIQ